MGSQFCQALFCSSFTIVDIAITIMGQYSAFAAEGMPALPKLMLIVQLMLLTFIDAAVVFLYGRNAMCFVS
eukprot:9415249-Ditylum_brightwellii.AAC.1